MRAAAAIASSSVTFPLLFERRLADQFDRIVLVDAPRPVRMERLVRDRGIEATEAMKMIASQMPAELKRARTDYLIDNTGTPAGARDARARSVGRAGEGCGAISIVE